jgi:hypothetical protein
LNVLKSLIKPMLPKTLLSAYRDHVVGRMQQRARAMSTREVFTDIYANNRWGGVPGEYCSGSGSSSSEIVTPYVACMRQQLAGLEPAQRRVIDLGCGDFAVGRELAGECVEYVGVDIVHGLIERNQAQFGSQRISFRCLDIIEDTLPPGRVCFLRQILQHLSNDQIRRILPKLRQFPWVFITEHQPSAGFLKSPNVDKPHGGDIRVLKQSGVYLQHPPFNVPAGNLQLVLEVAGGGAPDGVDPGVIRTFLLRH